MTHNNIFFQHRPFKYWLATTYGWTAKYVWFNTTAVEFYMYIWHFHKLNLYNERQKVKVYIAHMSLNEILVKFIFKIWIVDIKCKRMSS